MSIPNDYAASKILAPFSKVITGDVMHMWKSKESSISKRRRRRRQQVWHACDKKSYAPFIVGAIQSFAAYLKKRAAC
jgi:hypothetical protein